MSAVNHANNKDRQATILVVEDDDDLRTALADILTDSGYAAVTAAAGSEALAALARQRFSLVLTDVQMQPMDGFELLLAIREQGIDVPVMMMTAHGDIPQAVRAMQAGAADFLAKPFAAGTLLDRLDHHVQESIVTPAGDWIAADPRSREIMTLAGRVAASDATVMITGESGTGKEVLARYIHQQSPRAHKPFVAVNCAAIPENMLEAVLFGYEKGAFTGALQATPGKFELAQHGTLLLDEITEMDINLQAKLLRVLQERELERLGSRKTITLDVRVLATSNRQLQQSVAEGHFREDLYYRLNVFPVELPPLRERTGDIVPVAEALLARRARLQGRRLPRLSLAAQEKLLAWQWPGNVRELGNVMERAMIMLDGDVLEAAMLHFESALAPRAKVVTSAAPAPASEDNLDASLKEQEHGMILQALRAGKGSRKRAAEALGISPRTLRYKLARMREAGIEVPEVGNVWA